MSIPLAAARRLRNSVGLINCMQCLRAHGLTNGRHELHEGLLVLTTSDTTKTSNHSRHHQTLRQGGHFLERCSRCSLRFR